MPVRVFVSGWNRTYVPGSSPSIFIQLWMTCPVSWRASCFRVCHNSPSLNWKVKIQKCLVKAANFLVLVLRKIKKDYLLKLTGKFHACNFLLCNTLQLFSPLKFNCTVISDIFDDVFQRHNVCQKWYNYKNQ